MKFERINFALLGLLVVLAGSTQASQDKHEQVQPSKVSKSEKHGSKARTGVNQVVRNAGLRSDGELVQAQPAPKPMPYESAKKGAGKQPVLPIGQNSISAGATGSGAAQTSSTGVGDCEGVGSCNDFIVSCIALGGNVTATSYDPDSGAPSGATCYGPGN